MFSITFLNSSTVIPASSAASSIVTRPSCSFSTNKTFEGQLKPSKPFSYRRFSWLTLLFHRFHTGSVFSAIGSISPALSSGFPNLILCCFCTTITPDDLSPRVSHPRDLILRSFSARKYRCFSVLPLTKSILISPNRNSGDFVL